MAIQAGPVVVSSTRVSRLACAPKRLQRPQYLRPQASSAPGRVQVVPSATPATQTAAATPTLATPQRLTSAPHNAAARRAAAPPLFGDSLLEASRPHLRSVFELSNWEALRNTNRYFRHLLSIHKSRVLRGLAAQLVYVTGLSVAVCACGAAQQAGLLPTFLPALGAQLRQFYGLTSFALALLLVFRTNTSYARWEESRKMWGMVLNRTREVCRLGLTWICNEKRQLRAMLCRWAPAFSKTLLCHLRKGEDLRKELEGLLLPHEVEGVLRAQHRPNYVLQVLFHIVHSAGLPDRVTLRLQDSLTQLEDCLGGCERVLDTPVPVLYTRHTSRFLVVWLTSLPFALWPTCGAFTPPLSLLIAFLLLGIEKIGVSIEEPFSILALEDIAGTAQADVRELAAMHGSREAALGSSSSSSSSSSSLAGNSSSSSQGHSMGSSGRFLYIRIYDDHHADPSDCCCNEASGSLAPAGGSYISVSTGRVVGLSGKGVA